MSRLLAVQSLDDFQQLSYGLEIETYNDLRRCLQNGMLSFSDPLGCLLELLRFDRSDSLKDFIHYKDDPLWKSMQDNRITPESPASFYQDIRSRHAAFEPAEKQIAEKIISNNKIRPSDRLYLQAHIGLLTFAELWKQKQEDEVLWNPPYAEVNLPDKVKMKGQQLTPFEILREFDLSGLTEDSTRDFLLYPFTGFDLANLLEQSYSGQSRYTHKS